jgi:hypothetical protein
VGIDLDHLPAIEKWNFPLWKNKWTKFKSTQKITEELCGAGLIRVKDLFLDGSLGTSDSITAHYDSRRDTTIMEILSNVPAALTVPLEEGEEASRGPGGGSP